MKTNIFSEIAKTIALLFENVMFEASEMSAKIALIKERSDGESDFALYIRSLKRITIVIIVFPLPILVFGIVKQLELFVSLAGLLWIIPTILLLLLASPLGLLISAITGRVLETGKRYVQFVLGVLLVELGFTLFVAVVPIENNLGMLPVAFVSACILGILTSMGIKTRFSRRWLGFVAANVLTFFVISCFFPLAAAKLRDKIRSVDDVIVGMLDGKIPISPMLQGCATTNGLDTVIYVNAKEKKFTVSADNTTIIHTNATNPFFVIFEDDYGREGKYPVPAGKYALDYTCRLDYPLPWTVEIEGTHDSTAITMRVFYGQKRKR